jgi:hypothetical protein
VIGLTVLTTSPDQLPGLERPPSMDILWIMFWIAIVSVVLAGLSWLAHRLSPMRERGAETEQQRLDEAEMLTHSKRPFM